MKNGAMKMMPDSVISTPALPPATCPEPRDAEQDQHGQRVLPGSCR